MWQMLGHFSAGWLCHEVPQVVTEITTALVTSVT